MLAGALRFREKKYIGKKIPFYSIVPVPKIFKSRRPWKFSVLIVFLLQI